MKSRTKPPSTIKYVIHCPENCQSGEHTVCAGWLANGDYGACCNRENAPRPHVFARKLAVNVQCSGRKLQSAGLSTRQTGLFSLHLGKLAQSSH
jgi:hypothetical protein